MFAAQKSNQIGNTVTPPRHLSSPHTNSPQGQQTPTSAVAQSQMASATAVQTPQASSAGGGLQSPQTSVAPQLSEEQLTREKERVALLFEINQALIQKLVQMQQQGKGGNVPGLPNPDETQKASPDYVEYV